MTRPVVVLRPEPGNADTAARVEAAGLTAIRMPIFEARPLAWAAPDPTRFDALLVTSAQAVRLAGEGLAALSSLPVVAVGARTAEAARQAGLTVAVAGDRDAAAAIARAEAAGLRRLLHLAGRDRTASTAAIEAVTVYESVRTGAPQIPPGAIVLLHSARAAAALAETAERAGIGLVAISAAVLAAAGQGWREARVAAAPDDDAVVEAARALAIDPPGVGGDKAA